MLATLNPGLKNLIILKRYKGVQVYCLLTYCTLYLIILYVLNIYLFYMRLKLFDLAYPLKIQ